MNIRRHPSGLRSSYREVPNNLISRIIAMSHRSRSSMRLVNMVFYARHGVLREEQALGAKYEIDATLWLDFTDAAKNDDIAKTVDYGVVYQKIREQFTQKTYKLLETLAFDLAGNLLRDFPVLDEVSIRIRKHNPPIDGICDFAEAEYLAERNRER